MESQKKERRPAESAVLNHSAEAEATTQISSLPYLIGSMEAGEYRPAPGTVGARLIETHPCAFHRGRSLARFARAALRYEGIWWPLILSAAPEMVADYEADYVALCWREWIDGKRPFGGSRRVPR